MGGWGAPDGCAQELPGGAHGSRRHPILTSRAIVTPSLLFWRTVSHPSAQGVPAPALAPVPQAQRSPQALVLPLGPRAPPAHDSRNPGVIRFPLCSLVAIAALGQEHGAWPHVTGALQRPRLRGVRSSWWVTWHLGGAERTHPDVRV